MRASTRCLSWSVVACLCLACEGRPPVTESTPEVAEGAARSSSMFREVAIDSGLEFVHFNGMSGQRYFSEHMGGGAALFDYDSDGDLDLFLTQGNVIEPGVDASDATFPWKGDGPPRDRLFRNESSVGETRFVDATATSGIAGLEYAIGAAVGDVDNDGRPDLFVMQWGAPNRLYRNLGDGRFQDVTASAGVGETEWSVSASFVDYDRDGWLDLYIANYNAFALPLHKDCRSYTGALDYCGPNAFRPLSDSLFRNRGDGTFDRVSESAGIEGSPGSGLGVVALDANDDLIPDFYVANDQMPNRMWIGSERGVFQDGALLDGTALNAEGHPEAGMGIAVGDVDRDGREDLLVTHLTRETHTLYRNEGARGSSSFFDVTAESGLGGPSFASTGFGVGWLDVDNDGWLDLFVANGAVKYLEPLVRAGDRYPMHQPNQLFVNLGDGRFEEVVGEPAIELSEVSRGAAFGDIDNDGDTDIVVVNNAGPVRLLRNEVGDRSAWLGVDVRAAEGRAAIGARVQAIGGDDVIRVRSVRRDGSYASASDPRILFGFGGDGSDRDVLVQWPDGERERWSSLALGRYHRLVRSTGGSPAAEVGGDR